MQKQIAAVSTAAVGLGLLTACPPPPTETAFINVLTDKAQIQADGSSTAKLTINSFVNLVDGDKVTNTPDVTPVTLKVTSNTGDLQDLSGAGVTKLDEDDPASDLYTVTPTANGDVATATADFLCVPFQTATITITASNGRANDAVKTVECLKPVQEPLIFVDASDCEAGVNQLIANGETACAVKITVFNDLDQDGLVSATDTRLRGALINVAAETDKANDIVEGNFGALLSLAADDGINDRENEFADLETDEDGETVIFVHARKFDVTENITISATASQGPLGDLTLTAEDKELEVAPLVSKAELEVFQVVDNVELPAGPLNLVAGQAADFRIRTKDLNGQESDQISLIINQAELLGVLNVASDGSELDGDGNLILEPDGNGSVDFTIVSNEDIVDITSKILSIRLFPEDLNGAKFDEFSDEEKLAVVAKFEEVSNTEITVAPPGNIVVNVAIEDKTIFSDQNGDAATSDVTVTVTQDNEPQQGAQLSFNVREEDLAKIGFGLPGAILPTTVTGTTDANGKFTVQVSAQSTRVRGTTIVEIDTVVPGNEIPIAQQQAEIVVDRQPILQSVVFNEANPTEIGVLGSSRATSSVVSFTIFDDENQPLPNVPVTFAVNATAGTGTSVVPDAISDATGVVSTVLSAGTQAGPVTVVARANLNGISLTVESASIGITGGLPSFANSFLLCNDDNIVQKVPMNVNCIAQLADRFTNRVDANTQVQFRAEGGNITPVAATDGEGVATAVYNTGNPPRSVASLFSRNGDSWSYGAIVPKNGDLRDSGDFDPDPCFDNDPTTACDLVAMCANPGNEVFCPLPVDPFSGVQCWDTLELEALTNPLVNGRAFFDVNDPNHAFVVGLVDDYLRTSFNCGFPSACLLGQNLGLDFIEGDECQVSSGCFDFDRGTECPEDGYNTIIASARGEESFVDINGNGVFDFDDVNGNGLHDRGETNFEPFVDMPEPYLDKNDNTSRDVLFNSPRLQSIDEIRHTDLFSDEDDSGDFGYLDNGNVAAARLFTNEQLDRDKEIFFSGHMIGLEGGMQVSVGQLCGAESFNRSVTCQANPAVSATCIPVAADFGLAPGCIPGGFAALNGFTLSARVTDVNGNCFSENLAGNITADEGQNVGSILLETTTIAMDRGYCRLNRGFSPFRPWAEFINAGISVVRNVNGQNIAVTGAGAGVMNFTVQKNCIVEGEQAVDIQPGTFNVTGESDTITVTNVIGVLVDCTREIDAAQAAAEAAAN